MLAEFRYEVPEDPMHPFYYHVYTNTLPKEMMYRMIPKKKEIVTENFKWSQRKGNRRLIFEWPNYTDYEKAFIEEMKDEVLKRYKIDLR